MKEKNELKGERSMSRKRNEENKMQQNERKQKKKNTKEDNFNIVWLLKKATSDN